MLLLMLSKHFNFFFVSYWKPDSYSIWTENVWRYLPLLTLWQCLAEMLFAFGLGVRLLYEQLRDLLVRCMVQRGRCMGMFQLRHVLDWKGDAGLQSYCPLKFRIGTSCKIHNQLGLSKFILPFPLLRMPLRTWKCTSCFCLRIRS